MTASTTYPLVRAGWATAVKALTPAFRPDETFDLFTDRLAGETFQEWAAKNPTASFRKYIVERSGPRLPPPVCNGTIEQHTVEAEMTIAYPRERDGYDRGDQAGELDLEDVIDADAEKVVRAIGVTGANNYVSGQMLCHATYRTEAPDDDVVFLVVELETTFYRTVEEAVPAATQNSGEQTLRRETSGESDELAVTFDTPMFDVTYHLTGYIDETGYEGVVVKLKPGTATRLGCTVMFSATVEALKTVCIDLRDAS